MGQGEPETGAANSIIKIDGSLVAEASKLLDKFGLPGFISSVLGVPQDYLEKWRSNNLIRWYGQYQKHRADNLREGKPVPPLSLLVPALRAIVDEDDTYMLDLWARLVAGFDGPGDARPRKVFVSLLTAMTSADAKLLVYLLGRPAIPNTRTDVDTSEQPFLQEELETGAVASALGAAMEGIPISAGNLARLGCLRLTSRANYLIFGGPKFPPTPIGAVLLTDYGEFYPTELGRALVQALPGVTVEGS